MTVAQLPGVNNRAARNRLDRPATLKVRYWPPGSIASNCARSRNRSPSANPAPSSAATVRIPFAQVSKPDHVITIGSPARNPAVSARPSPDTIRAFTVSECAPSPSATSSPCHRYVSARSPAAIAALLVVITPTSRNTHHVRDDLVIRACICVCFTIYPLLWLNAVVRRLSPSPQHPQSLSPGRSVDGSTRLPATPLRPDTLRPPAPRPRPSHSKGTPVPRKSS